jgi:quinol monooxygenase YgiN
MYGTVATMKVKPGMMDKLRETSMNQEQMNIPGLVHTYVYQMDADPNTLMLAVVFTDKDAYVKNAGSPEQNQRYQQMLALLEGPPEWHDGEIVYPEK